MRAFFGFAVAVAIAIFAAALFAGVLPLTIAVVLGIVIGIIEIAGSARGESIRALMRVDALVLAWPAAAAALYFVGLPDRNLRISIAAGIAAAFAAVAGGRGSGEDDARIRVALLSVVIVSYALLRTLVQPTWDLWALAAAAAAAAVPLLIVASGAIVLPHTHKLALRTGAYLCVIAAMGDALGASGWLRMI